MLFCMFMTRFAHATLLVSSSGKPVLAAPDTVPLIRKRGPHINSPWLLPVHKAHTRPPD